MNEGAGTFDGVMLDLCHFDVIVHRVPEEEEIIDQMTSPQWLIVSDPKYTRMTTPGGILGGIWNFPSLAVDTILFFSVTDVNEFLDVHGNVIDTLLWNHAHPRDGMPAAIFRDIEGVIWGIHEHRS